MRRMRISWKLRVLMTPRMRRLTQRSADMIESARCCCTGSNGRTERTGPQWARGRAGGLRVQPTHSADRVRGPRAESGSSTATYDKI